MSWQVKTIDQLGKVVTGKTPSTKNRAMYDGNYMFVTPTDLDWQSYYVRSTHSTVTDLAREKHKNQFIPANSTVFTCIGNTIGKCGLTTEDCISNQQINTVVPNDEHDSKFVYYLLNHNRPKIRSIGLSGGAAQPIINKSTFSAIKVLTPDTKIEEEKISSVLSAYDDLIENSRRRIALLEEAARLLYREWFVHFRFPGHEHVKIIDGVPEGWKQTAFGKLFDFVGGFAFKSSTYAEDGKYGVITIKNVHDAKFISECTSRVDDVPPKMKKSCCLATGDILLSLTGNVGRACIVFGDNYLLNQRVAKICGKKGVSDQFTYWTFSNPDNQRQLENLAYGVAQLNLSPVKLSERPFLRPEQALMDDFTDTTKPIYDQLIKLNLCNQELAKARDLLIPRLMDGRIEV